MAVYRNRSTTSVPASLSISYLIGSPPTGTSMMTLTSRGGSIPIEMASMRMDGSAGRVAVKSWIRTRRGPGPVSRRFETRRSSMGPGEGDLVERLGPEFLGTARDHAAAEGAIKLRRSIVVGERPDHHAFQPALQQIAPRGGKQPAAEAEPLKFRPQIKLVDLAFEVQAARAVAAVIGITRDLVAEHQHADAAALADRAVPPLRAATVDQLLELGTGNDTLLGRAPGFVMGGRHRSCVRSSGRPNLDQGCAHGSNQSKSARPHQGPSLIIG